MRKRNYAQLFAIVVFSGFSASYVMRANGFFAGIVTYIVVMMAGLAVWFVYYLAQERRKAKKSEHH